MVSLDATCGDRKWPEKRPTISIDIDPSKHPDMVMDATDLKFPDAYFDEIYCQPPYVVNGGKLQRLIGRFAHYFHRRDWQRFLTLSEAEFRRCLKPSGTLHYNVDEGRWWGMAHYQDVVREYANGWKLNWDKKTRVKRPMGDTYRHILVFKKL